MACKKVIIDGLDLQVLVINQFLLLFQVFNLGI